MAPARYDPIRYLEAKQSVDERAINQGVLDALAGELSARPPERRRVLELGAGLGSMAARLYARGVLDATHYSMLDRDAAALRVARRVEAELPDFRFAFIEADVHDYLRSAQARTAHDVCVANAVLDLLDLPVFLAELWQALPPDGLFWSSINFDGETIFLPELPLDGEVMARYHASMDGSAAGAKRAGDSRAGRHLLEQLRRDGARVLAAGSSDWVVWPRAGAYPHDEAYFLHHIVHTIDGELRAASQGAAEAEAFGQWVSTRHRQIDAGELSYIAHQLDVLAQAP